MMSFQPLFTISLTLISTALMSDLQLSVNQQERDNFLSATVGDNITLRCAFFEDVKTGAKIYWYRQKVGKKPVLMSSHYKYDWTSKFHGEFHGSKRFTLNNDDDKNDLQIQNTSMSDSAVYHCVRCFLHQSEFLKSVTVIVKSLKPTFKVQQSPHEDIKPGRSVILNCSVQTESCDGHHRVHWFKQSEGSAAGVLYSHGGSSDQCESNIRDSPTNSCVYTLPIHNVSSEKTGTYYCAVAACGQVLFGNGTRINIKDVSLNVVYVLSGVSVFSTSLVIGLTFILCTKNNTDTCMSNSVVKTKDFPKLLQYKATEQVNRRSGQTHDTWSQCVYFSVEK